MTDVDSFKSEKFSESFHLSLEVVNQSSVRVFIHDRLTDDLLGTVRVPAHIGTQ